MSRFGHTVFWTLTARAGELILSVASVVLLARLLGPTGKGLFSLAVLLPQLIYTLTHAGIGPATAYHIAQKRFPPRQMLANSLLLVALLAGIGLVCGWVLVAVFQPAFFNGVPRTLLYLSLLIFPANLLVLWLHDTLLGAKQFDTVNRAIVGRALLLLALVALAVGVAGIGVAGAVLAQFAAAAFAAGLLLRKAGRHLGGWDFTPLWEYLRSVARFGIKTHVGSILHFFVFRADQLLLNVFWNPMAVGYYSVAVAVSERLWMASETSGMVLFPHIAAGSGEGADPQEGGHDLTPRVARTVLWLMLPAAGILFLASGPLIGLLFSPAFAPAIEPLRILLPGTVAFGVSRVLAQDLAGRNRLTLNNWVTLGTLAANVGLNLAWIPGRGIVGAAWASACSYLLAMILQTVLYCRITGVSWTRVLLPQRGDAARAVQVLAALFRRPPPKP